MSLPVASDMTEAGASSVRPEVAGVTRQSITNIEGAHRVVSIEILWDIACRLQIPPVDLANPLCDQDVRNG